MDLEKEYLMAQLQAQEDCYNLVTETVYDLRSNNRDLRFIVGLLERETAYLRNEIEADRAKTTNLEERMLVIIQEARELRTKNRLLEGQLAAGRRASQGSRGHGVNKICTRYYARLCLLKVDYGRLRATLWKFQFPVPLQRNVKKRILNRARGGSVNAATCQRQINQPLRGADAAHRIPAMLRSVQSVVSCHYSNADIRPVMAIRLTALNSDRRLNDGGIRSSTYQPGDLPYL